MSKPLYLSLLIATSGLIAEETTGHLPCRDAEKRAIEHELSFYSRSWGIMPNAEALLKKAKEKGVTLDSELIFLFWCICDDATQRQVFWQEGAYKHHDWALDIMGRFSDEQRKKRAHDFEGAGEIKAHHYETDRASRDTFSETISAITATLNPLPAVTPQQQEELCRLKAEINSNMGKQQDEYLLRQQIARLDNYNELKRADLELWWLMSTSRAARELLLAYYRSRFTRDWDFEHYFSAKSQQFHPEEAQRRISEIKRVNEAVSKLEGPLLYVDFENNKINLVTSGSIRASSIAEWKQKTGMEATQQVSIVVQLPKACTGEQHKQLLAEAKKANLYVQRVLGSTGGIPGYYDIEVNPYLKPDKAQ